MEVYYYCDYNENYNRKLHHEQALFVIGSRMFEINKFAYDVENSDLTIRVRFVKASNYRLLSDTDYILDENIRKFMLENIPKALKNEGCSTIVRTKFKKSLIKLMIKIKNYT